ncbi:G-type lectin S-receptor-like serine/threonine-protein kinase At4g27290 isoform X2 [Rutidosis leptorrhynchoides]|uniref:G-type lectin S-receptor-like serine/threonine-protein kinase At4g27290 isoform X2 n=1 Tax=Rutidosis leptorrhynchoides TaxID=125765 RepID=UPI003A99D443
MNLNLMLLPAVIFLILALGTCGAVDTIYVDQNIKDGETIVSANEKFELGFFSPGSSKSRYLGIWFKNTSPHTVVWVANRKYPLNDTSGKVILGRHGILSIVNSGGTIIWSSSNITNTNVIPIAQLLDTGNLVIRDEMSVVWQSFDYPGDTFISGMKLRKNLITGREMYLRSWRSVDDPFPGMYTIRLFMGKGKYPQVYICKSSVIQTRLGPLDGIEFAGRPNSRHGSNRIYKTEMVVTQKEIYFGYSANSTVLSSRSVVTPGGKLEIWVLSMQNYVWMQDSTIPTDYCDNYGLCGPYGSCSTNTYPNCQCLKGFAQKEKPHDLNPYNWTNGCRRSNVLDCGPGEGFLKLSSMKLPDTQNVVFDGTMSLQECEIACKDNCSCTAYANPNITRGSVGCLRWFGELIDVRVYSMNGQDLYVRLAASELLEGNLISKSSFSRKYGILIAILLISFAAGVGLAVAYACRKKKIKRHMKGKRFHKMNGTVQIDDLDELPYFSLHEIAEATDNFSISNKIGEGGFGPVYKGVLGDKREVAVKRLSETSHQGLDEFKNEVICIAKLQQRNLVKLVGYCIHDNELILIYEYMPNKSLDTFLFDETRRSILDWPKRFHIINGMARGILYLHQDSRLQIIHRDLKAANILLDNDMNPKIADFGLARKFVGSDNAVSTKRVMGTYGYISPEYALHGQFSTKSDVFSFGVLVLEIVSGNKNRGFFHEDHSDSLLGHAWRLYKENRSIELMCPSLNDSCIISEVLRSIHVGLLCVQHHAQDRPTMFSVVLMLVSEGVLPQPKQPAFFAGPSEQVQSVSSVNEYMRTQLYAR